jgi:hypothetical protein
MMQVRGGSCQHICQVACSCLRFDLQQRILHVICTVHASTSHLVWCCVFDRVLLILQVHQVGKALLHGLAAVPFPQPERPTCTVQPAWRPPPPVIRQDALCLKVLQHLQ